MTDQVSPEGGATPITSGTGPASGATPVSSSTTPAQTTAGTPTETKAESPPAVETPAKEPKGFMRRIDELTRHRRDAERDRDYWRDFAVKLQQQPRSQAPQQQPTTQPSAHPTQSQPQFLSPQEIAQQVREQMEHEQRRTKFDERVAKFAETVEDYSAVVTESTPISEAMAEVITDMDEPGALLYYLGQNDDIARKLWEICPQESDKATSPKAWAKAAAKVGRELERIAERLVTERAKAAEKPVSQAPPPPPKIEGSDPGNVERDPKKMTQKQFNKWREGFIGKRR